MSAIDLFSDLETRRDVARAVMSRQQRLALEMPPRDFEDLLRAAMLADIKDSPLSRAQIAAEMGRITGREVGPATLDAWVADSKPHRLPADLVPAWVIATRSRRVLEVLSAESGYWLADEEEHSLARLQRAQLQRSKLSSEINGLQRKLRDRV